MAFGTIMGQGLNLPDLYGNLVELRTVQELPKIGSTIKITEGSVNQDYIVAHVGNPNPNIYDASCDGIWVVRKQTYETNIFGGAIHDSFFDTLWYENMVNDLFNTIPSTIRDKIKNVKIPYYYVTDGWTGNLSYRTKEQGYNTKCFPLSGVEMNCNALPNKQFDEIHDGAILDYFKNTEGIQTNWRQFGTKYATRTPYESETNNDVLSICFDGAKGDSMVPDSTDIVIFSFILPYSYFPVKYKKSLYTLDGQFIMDVPEV